MRGGEIRQITGGGGEGTGLGGAEKKVGQKNTPKGDKKNCKEEKGPIKITPPPRGKRRLNNETNIKPGPYPKNKNLTKGVKGNSEKKEGTWKKCGTAHAWYHTGGGKLFRGTGLHKKGREK